MDSNRIRKGRNPSGPVEMPDIEWPPDEPEFFRVEGEPHGNAVCALFDKEIIRIAVSGGSPSDFVSTELTKEQALELAEFLQWHGGGRW